MDSGEACVDKLAPPSECGEVRDPLAAPGGRGAANILCGPPAVGMRLWRGLGGRLEKEDRSDLNSINKVLSDTTSQLTQSQEGSH